MVITSNNVWPHVARICGLPIDGVKRAVVTFDVGEPVQAEIDMFAITPSRPRVSVWNDVGAGTAPFSESG